MGVVPAEQAVLRVEGVMKHYRRRRAFGPVQSIRGLDNLSLRVHRGEILSVVGPSGSGKSTLARCLALLEPPDEGVVYVQERPVTMDDERALRSLRRKVQLVFQDPVSSINPSFTVLQVLEEPVELGRGTLSEIDWGERLAEVGLSPSILSRRARSLSGGQLQRLVLARALLPEPDALILDESLSGLDLSLQAKLANLVLDLVERRSLACVLITHNPALATHLGDRIVSMADGRLVEAKGEGSTP